MTTQTNLPRLAVFIDAENVGIPSRLDLVFDKIASARLGTPVVKRAYGNPGLLQRQTWVDACNKHGIEPVSQKHFVKGKSSADVKLVVDAMQLWYDPKKAGDPIDVFCFVSSDTDFRPLVEFIATGNRKAYGFGKDDTPSALKEVFGDGFFSFENLLLEPQFRRIRDAAAAILEYKKSGALGYVTLSKRLRAQLGEELVPSGFSPKAVLKDDPRFDVEQDANRAVLISFVRASRYLDNLQRSTKPRKVARLRASVSVFFLNKLTEPEIDAILSALKKAGVRAADGRIVYPGETKRND